MNNWINERVFSHSGPNGTVLRATRCDFRDGVEIFVGGKISAERLMQDISAIIGYHAVNIRPLLNGFAGYDTVKFPKPKKIKGPMWV